MINKDQGSSQDFRRDAERIALVTDSASDISADIAGEFGIIITRLDREKADLFI
jgi:hypothetical protein